MRNLVIAILLVACASAACAQVPQDVPRNHWAYRAVEELANKGYVLGYPDGRFIGDRTLTRYEFATVVKRIVDRIDEMSAAPKQAPADASQEDIASVRKLVEEFKVELIVIGSRLDTLESSLAELKGRLDNVCSTVAEQAAALESTRDDVAKMKKVALSGYVQARYQTIDFDNENQAEDSSVDTFLVRRARVKVTAKPTERSAAVLQLDLGKNDTTVKDAYLGYALGRNSAVSPSFRIGQQYWWFGYEVPYSSSKRETPERALFVRRFFPGERDQGAVIQGPADARFNWIVGVYNGTGTQDDSLRDLNNAKDALVYLKWRLGNLDFGVSGYRGRGVWQTFGDAGAYLGGVPRIRYGADLQYYPHRLAFKAEYIRGKGVDEAATTWDQGKYVDGYYAQLGYAATSRDTLVARYASMSQDPVSPQFGRRSAWDLGVIRWLDSSSRIKFFYKINAEQLNPIDNNGLAAEWLVVY